MRHWWYVAVCASAGQVRAASTSGKANYGQFVANPLFYLALSTSRATDGGFSLKVPNPAKPRPLIGRLSGA